MLFKKKNKKQKTNTNTHTFTHKTQGMIDTRREKSKTTLHNTGQHNTGHRTITHLVLCVCLERGFDTSTRLDKNRKAKSDTRYMTS